MGTGSSHIAVVNDTVVTRLYDDSYVAESKNGTLYMSKYEKIHRDFDLPACIAYDNNGQLISAMWYQHGLLHRDHGPAIIYYHGSSKETGEYYKNGRKIEPKKRETHHLRRHRRRRDSYEDSDYY
jgi:antitoxin component YwqK of YwqJK toxin-antitoxin module